MILFKETNFKVIVGDIETLKECFDLGFYNPDTLEWHEFEISKYKNDLYKFVKFYTSKNWDYVCGYNYIGFDAQVIQYVLDNYEDWFDFTGEEISRLVYKFAQKVIDDSKYGLFPTYRESQFEIKVIDAYTIFGLDNEARRSSLKKCEFQIDFPSVEEMPIHHSQEGLMESDIAEIKSYRRNDVMATNELLNMVIGNTTHPVYAKNNQLELRASIKESFGIECMNLSDIAIGDNIIKQAYAKAKNLNIKDLPRKGTFRKSIALKKCIPSYVEFKTPALKELHKTLQSKVVSQTDAVEFEFSFYGTKYKLALGGLHSVNRNEIYTESKHYKIHDYDVSSFYPAILVELGYYPYHLGKELLAEYSNLYHKRLELKPLAKSDKKIKGIVEGLKLSLNSVFGKMGSMESWLYDKQALLSVTLTGQFCLLMLIEAYELAGFHVISANTDGVTVLVAEGRDAEIEQINKEWQEKTRFVLERALYKKIVYSTVNDYIAFTEEGKVKTKGDFISNFDLWKNKSARVVPLALQAYFVEGKDPIQFIESYPNIYDFCIMERATGTTYLEEQWDEGTTVNTKKHQKLVRFYYSNTGRKLYKRGIGTTGKPMNVCKSAPNELGYKEIQYFNKYEKKDNYNISHKHYILKALEMIDAIEKTNKAKSYIASMNQSNKQLNLF